jgi:chromosome segregation ATPase
MSFSDMMSSGRGPGVIGMVMALIVLLGFGLLFMFAFDEGFQGAEQSIESVIKNQARDIENYKTEIPKGRQRLAEAPGRIAISKELARLKHENTALQQKIAGLKESVTGAKAGLTKSGETFEAYKDQYRAFVRGKAKGTAMEQLETVTGAIYKNVSIREVTAVGIQIRHDDGQKRIPFEELPDEMKDYYQFDPNQKESALASESAHRDQLDAAVAVVNERVDQEMAVQREKDAALAKDKLRNEIAAKEAQLVTVKSDIEGLERDIERAADEAAAARAAGRMVLNKSGSLNSKMRTKRNRLSQLQSEILQMKARL